MNDLYRQLVRERYTPHIRSEDAEPTEDTEFACAARQRALLEAIGADGNEAAA